MNLVDGRALAEKMTTELQTALAQIARPLTLAVIACAPNFETTKYLAVKRRQADALGVQLKLIQLPETATTAEVMAAVTLAAESSDGVLVQLPLPASINRGEVLAAIPARCDVDGFSYDGHASTHGVLPPVVGAIDVISKTHGVLWSGKSVVIFGAGRLVGKPAGLYARSRGAITTVVDISTSKMEVIKVTLAADIIILGVGVPGVLTPEMVRNGVVVFDAGASEDGGQLVGDADPTVAEKASLFTPVPGGIGPLTVTILFKNLLQLTNQQ